MRKYLKLVSGVFLASFFVSITASAAGPLNGSEFGGRKYPVLMMENISAKTGLTKDQAKKTLDAFIALTTKSLKSDKPLALLGLGTFSQGDSEIIFDPDQSLVQAAAYRYFQNLCISVVSAEAELIREFSYTNFKGEDFFFEASSFYLQTLSKNPEAAKADAAHIAAPFVPGGSVISLAVVPPLSEAVEAFSREKGFEFVADKAWLLKRSQALLKATDLALNVLIQEQSKTFIDPKIKNIGLTPKQFNSLLKEAELNENELVLFLQVLTQQLAQAVVQTAEGITIDGLGSFFVPRSALDISQELVAAEMKVAPRKVVHFRPGAALASTVKSFESTGGKANKTGGKYVGQVQHF
ncbi:HU family DNA-binding protein [Bdellovibrionota bacterium FG-2]